MVIPSLGHWHLATHASQLKFAFADAVDIRSLAKPPRCAKPGSNYVRLATAQSQIRPYDSTVRFFPDIPRL